MLARFALLALGMLMAAHALAVETVRVRAGAHDGFGRLAFDWKQPVEFSAKIDGERLVVSFARPFAADYADVRRHLHAYLGPAAPAKDGRSVAFPLLRPVSVQTATIDGVLVVDLRDGKGKGDGKPAESVGVRAGEHDGFSRIVFDWRRDVPYKVETRDGAATVTFSRAAAIDATAVERDRPRFVEGLETRRENGRTIAELRFAPGARLRHFRDGPRIAVDVLAPTEKPQPKPQASAPAPKPSVKAEAGSPAGEPETKSKPEPKAEPRPARAAETKAAPDPKAPRVALVQDGRTARLEFGWPRPTPAAAFVRAGHLWLVFGAKAELDLNPLVRAGGPVVKAEQVAHRDVSAIRLRLRDGLAPSLRREGGVWSVRLGPPTPPASAVAATAEPSAAPKPRVFIAAAEPGSVVELVDPEVGDRLIVVPTLAGGQGAPAGREFVEFALLPSAQGVALRPKAPDLQVRAVKGGVAVTAAQGLALSAPPPAREAPAKPQSVADAAFDAPIMDLAAWSRPEKTSFSDEKQALQLAVATAPKAARNAARWELAKFLFANDFAPEALAQLELIQESDPSANRDPAFRAVRGAALLLAHRPAEAATVLAHGELDRYADVALWRGAALAADKRWEEANRQFGVASAGLKAMPASLRERLLLAWAKAAAEAGDLRSADLALGMARELPQTPALEAQIALISGHASELRREPDVALEQYALAEASSYRPVRGRAALARIDLLLKREAIDADEAIAELERLHFAWRGDEFEIELMRRLAELRFAKQDYAGGLELLRQAVTYFPKSPQAKPLAQEMARVFSELFQDGKADALSPVNALALYYEFKELTPAGAAGDSMIQKLADRLVDVDLLDQAAKLLEHQVTYRLRGLEQARVGSRLALVRLLGKQPQKALDSLEKTRAANLDAALETERRQLAARAYADLGRGAEALRLLEGDASASAALLRADVHWRAQKWPEAARALRELLAAQDDDDRPLDELAQAQVVKLAVALYMGNDAAGLDALRRRYGARMAEGRHADSFRLLTAEIDPSKVEFRKLAGAIARVDELEAFMANYRTKLAQKSLSAIN